MKCKEYEWLAEWWLSGGQLSCHRWTTGGSLPQNHRWPSGGQLSWPPVGQPLLYQWEVIKCLYRINCNCSKFTSPSRFLLGVKMMLRPAKTSAPPEHLTEVQHCI